MSAFFGFSGTEINAVVADLSAAGLVTVEGNSLRLHRSALDYFRGPEEDGPRILEVESWVRRLWFDLVSKNMVAPDRTRSARHLVDIRPAGTARDLPLSYAREAFEANFPEYLRRVLKMRNPDRFSLYSVSEVIAERFGSQVFRMEEELTFDPEPRLRPNLTSIDSDSAGRFNLLSEEILNAYRKLDWVQAAPGGVSEFSALSGEGSVADAYGGSARFDITKWLRLNPDRRKPDRQNLVGASYIRRNVDFLVNLIDNAALAPSVQASREREIVWYRPGGSNWGRSPDLQEALRSIKIALRRKYGKVEIRTRLVLPDDSRRDHPENFKNLFDEGYLAPPGFLHPSVEVVHVRGIAAIMLVTVALSPTVEVPVGFATSATDPLARIERKLTKVDAIFEEVWKGERIEEEEHPVGPEDEEPED
ncbi:hypothetical protein XH90_09400 [Bradyrhizobium sp. CCBAU 53338]|nr:hypothetical protein XH90_09400 [Bradyrhizobium sp. CCBAU 53338]